MQSVRHSLPRAVDTELSDALTLLRSTSESSSKRVHETRKHLKRARALLRLGAPGKKARRLQARLGLVARSLGRVRDPVAQADTWHRGEDYFEQPEREIVGAALAERRARLATPAREGLRLARAARVLEDVKERVARLDLHKASTRSVEHEARVAYRRARRALELVRSEPTAENVHELRRAAKRHQYQLQFLEQLAPKRLKAQRKQLHHLTELLGLHHDVVGIEEQVVTRAPMSGAGFERWQADLLTSALELSLDAFDERPRAFEKRLRGYLDSRKSHAHAA